jgi:hypothetical protein
LILRPISLHTMTRVRPNFLTKQTSSRQSVRMRTLSLSTPDSFLNITDYPNAWAVKAFLWDRFVLVSSSVLVICWLLRDARQLERSVCLYSDRKEGKATVGLLEGQLCPRVSPWTLPPPLRSKVTTGPRPFSSTGSYLGQQWLNSNWTLPASTWDRYKTKGHIGTELTSLGQRR